MDFIVACSSETHCGLYGRQVVTILFNWIPAFIVHFFSFISMYELDNQPMLHILGVRKPESSAAR